MTISRRSVSAALPVSASAAGPAWCSSRARATPSRSRASRRRASSPRSRTDRQPPHDDDEVYVVLEGQGVLDVEGKEVLLREGHALFVPAGAEHRFSGYEELSLLVIFERRPARAS